MASHNKTLLGKILLGCVLVVVCSCTTSEPDVSRHFSGDTLVVTSSPERAMIAAPSGVQVLLRDDRLERPIGMIHLGDTLLAIGDRTAIHVVTPAGRYLWTLGRQGDGPGEFASIAGIGASGDTLLVLDARHLRLTMMTGDGEVLETLNVGGYATLQSHPNLESPSGVLGVLGDTVRTVVGSLIQLGKPATKAAIEIAYRAGTASVLLEVDNWLWISAGRIMVPEDPLGARAVTAVGQDGSLVAGPGTEPCIVRMNPRPPKFARFCFVAQPVPAGNGVNAPDLTKFSEPQLSLYQATVRAQRPSSTRPYYDRVASPGMGETWIGTVDASFADFHPFIPPNAPPTQTWLMIDSTGKVVARIALPRAFMPRLRIDENLLGFLEESTGEIVMASVSLAALEE